MRALIGPFDYLCWDQFVHWFVHQSKEKPEFPTVVLFTNEAYFTQEGIFDSYNSHVWAEASPHAASVHCHQQCFVVDVCAGIVNNFSIGPYMLPRLSAQIAGIVNNFSIGPYMLPRLSAQITVCFWRKSYKKCWRKSHCQSVETFDSSMTVLWLTLHIRSENISSSLTMIAGLDGVGQWVSFPGHQASHQWTNSYGATLKTWFTCCLLILKRILLSVLLRSGSTLAFLSTHVSLCRVIDCVLRSVAICLNICSKFVWNTTFFSEYLSGFAWFPTLVRSSLMICSVARTHLWHIVPWQ